MHDSHRHAAAFAAALGRASRCIGAASSRRRYELLEQLQLFQLATPHSIIYILDGTAIMRGVVLLLLTPLDGSAGWSRICNFLAPLSKLSLELVIIILEHTMINKHLIAASSAALLPITTATIRLDLLLIKRSVTITLDAVSLSRDRHPANGA